MSISKNFFSVFILDGENQPVNPSAQAEFALDHGTEYTVLLINHHSAKQANVTLTIDGKMIGIFRIRANSHIEINRPTSQARRLTFYALGTPEASAGGLAGVSVDVLGTLKARFALERMPPTHANSLDVTDGPIWLEAQGGSTEEEFGVGGTALGRASTQRFGRAQHMVVDTFPTVIEARLVCTPSVVPL